MTEPTTIIDRNQGKIVNRLTTHDDARACIQYAAVGMVVRTWPLRGQPSARGYSIAHPALPDVPVAEAASYSLPCDPDRLAASVRKLADAARTLYHHRRGLIHHV